MTSLPKISRLQFALITFIYSIGGTINLIPRMVVQTAKNDAWLSIIISTILSIILSIFLVKLCSKYPHSTFIELTSAITGKFFGKILCLLYCFFFFQSSVHLIYLVTFYVNIIYFPETPAIALTIMLIILILINNYYGLGVMCRFNELISPIIIIGILFSIILSIPNMDLSNILPVLDQGIKPVINASIPLMGIPFGEIIIIIILYPYLNNQNNIYKIVSLTILSIGLIFLAIVFTALFVLDINEIEINYFTTYEIVRLVNIGEIIQRVDALYLLAFLLAIFIKIVSYNYLFILLFKQSFKIKNMNTLLIPLMIITASYSLYIFSNYVDMVNFIPPTSINIIIFGYIIPILLLVIYHFKKRYRNKLIN